jgi:hypothetical protein
LIDENLEAFQGSQDDQRDLVGAAVQVVVVK